MIRVFDNLKKIFNIEIYGTFLLIIFAVFCFFPCNVFAAPEVYTYSYTGEYQEFVASTTSKFRVQLWGAQGGDYDTSLLGGLGGYTEGVISLQKGDKLYVYVGSQPSSSQTNLYGGWNGGGDVPAGKDKDGRAGGGATDIRTIPTTSKTTWNAIDSLASRIMVAGGGGGSAYENKATWRSEGGPAGGLNGYTPQSMGSSAGAQYGTGATQISGGYAVNATTTAVAFGTLGKGGRGISTDGGSGGGGGFFGGGGSNVCSGGGGGSSYISGHNGCIAVDSSGTTIDTSVITTNQSHSFTGYIFEDTKIIDGLGYNWTDVRGDVVNQPTQNNLDVQKGNYGNGFARITSLRGLYSDNTLKSITSDKGELTPSFESSIFEYDLTLDTYDKEVEVFAEVNNEFATVTGTGVYNIKYKKTTKVDLVVTAENGDIQVYTINIKRKGLPEGEHSTKLAELDLLGESAELFRLIPEFDTNVTDYTINLGYSTLEVKLEAIAYDYDATVTIEGNDLILDNEGDIKITVSAPECSDTVYLIHYIKDEKAEDTYEFDYTGDYQTFVAPSSGRYQIELWGAQGGYGSKKGGNGAYTKGNIVLSKNEKLYIYVGNMTTHSYSFNGGALGRSYGFSGGGATDVRLTEGTWDDFNSLKSRIMVAAGGGGSENWSGASNGGAAGGLYSYDVPYYYTGSWAYTLNTGATQTSGGKGMVGANQSGGSGTFGGAGNGGSSYGGGGGSGYYGGAGGGDGGPMTSAGSGGSSYISGHIGCNSIDESSTANNIIHTDSNIHYSKKKFTDTVMIDGLGYKWIDEDGPTYTHYPGIGYGNHVVLDEGLYTGQPTIDGSGIQDGKEGNGYAKITPLFLKSENNYLKDIKTSTGELSPNFSSINYEYDLILDKEEREVDIEGILSDYTASITGNGHYKVKYGKTVKVELIVTSESGSLRTYTVNIKRKKLEDGEHSSLLADLDFIVEGEDIEPVMEPIFKSDVFEYDIVIPPNMIFLDVDIVPFDEEATTKVEGNGLIIENTGEITITVSEPNCDDSVYVIKYTKEEKPDDEYVYNYTGDYQTFIAPIRGNYRFELWGSQGASSNTKPGGLGAYTKGDIFLEKGETLYIYVGNSNLHDNSFNGGAIGRSAGFGGGGATDIRLIPGVWSDFNSLKSRIMVAAGGGGAEAWAGGSAGGAAGGIYSYDVPYYYTGSWSYTLNTGATQISGGKGMVGYNQSGSSGSFGIAGAGGRTYGGGGGAGYYSGAGGGDGGPMTSAGSGGSSYISGHLGCNSITENSTVSNIEHTGLSTHYSKKVFKNTVMIDGLGYKWIGESGPTYTYSPAIGYGNHVVLDAGLYTGQPTIKNDDTQVGKEGLGYAKVTPLFQSKNNYLLNLETNYGTFDKEFSPFETEYTLTLDKYEQHFTLKGETADKDAIVTGLQKYELHLGETRMVYVDVTAPNGEIRTYKIKVTRGNLEEGEHSTKLVSLKINRDKFALDPEFISIETNYKLEVPYSTIVLDVEAIPYDKTATIKIEGNGYLKQDEDNIIKVTITHPEVETTVYEVLVTREEDVEGAKSEFGCTNGYQKFIAPGSTYYRTQLWGASGGYGRTDWALKYRGGSGAYTEGEIYLTKGQEVYVYVGCTGEDGGTELSHIGGAGGFNGGASGGDDSNRDNAPEPGGGGGGATDIRLVKTSKVSEWKDFNSLKSRIMVAAGGGGGTYYGMGGAGGTLSGLTGYGNKSVPTQETGYAFGYGMKGITNSIGSGGAGGGYYGGYSLDSQAGGGGTSFVSGCENCIAIDKNSTEQNIISSGSNIHYSNYVFDKIKMASGDEVQPNPQGGYQTGNTGDGYAIITASKSRSENNFLKNITVDKGELTPEFDILTREYTVTVGQDDTEITIDAVLDDEKATMSGTGTFDVEAGENIYPIFVTAENGDIRVYTIKVIREKSNNPLPLDIEISGLVPMLCSVKDEYCNLTPEFNPDTNSYTMTVPSKIKQLEFKVIKANKYQTVIGEGIKLLEQGPNEIVIEVTSEDGSRNSSYTYNIVRDASGDANIENLVVVNPPTDIKFNPEVSDYYFSVPDTTSSLELEVTLEDSDASYEIEGNENFEDGINIVQIIVTAQNGDTKTYTLNVYKEQSGNTFLTDIKVSHDGEDYPLNPTYNKVISNYIVNVGNEVDNVDISATPEHSLTTVTGTGNVKLKTGTNKVNLVSTASDGSIQVYELYIIRAKSSDATLKSLDVLEGSLTPEFSSEQEEYSLDVNSGVTSLTLNPVVNNEKAKYKISGNSGFVLGTNKVVILVTAEDGTQKTYTLNVQRIASSNNYLSTLIIDKYDMTSIFNKEQEEYNIEFEEKIPTIRVSATPEDSKAKVTKTGIYNIKTGSNQIKVIVTAEDGSKRTYTLNIFQKGNQNDNLVSLTTSSTEPLSPSFTKDNTKYQLEVENNEDEITVIGVAEDIKARVTGNGTYHLDTGINVISITVTSEEGNEKIYQINVNRKKSTNNNASMIIAKESVLDPVFDKNKTSYTLKVLEDVTSLTLTVDLEDEAATYEVLNNENFQIGHNTVTIRVTAEDGTTKDYLLDVLRQEAGTTSDKLESLTVSEGTLSPDFSPETIYYEVEVPYNIDKIILSGELEDKNAEVEGFGEYNLVFGKNVLGVIVTSTEGVVRSYQVVVTRKKKDEARLSILQVTDSNLDPTFDKDIYEYNLKTNYTSLTIQAVPLDKNATFKIIGNGNLQIGNNDLIIRVTAEDGVTSKDYVLHVEREKSLNNNLKLLEIENVEINPVFSKTTTVYTATVAHDVNNILINAEAEDPLATVAGDGTIDLNMGVNYIDIIVTSEAGTKKVYTLIVTREADSNNYLASLMTSEGTLTPSFSKEINDYTVEVSYEVEDIVITGTPENTNAVVIGLQKYNLDIGDNNISVTVVAEDGSTNIYNIVVTRNNIVSSKLKNLSVTNYKLDEEFSSDMYDYNVTVDYEVESLELNIETLDKNATYEVIGNSDLKVGMNTITIVVTDSLGVEQSTYTLNVNKQNYSNNFLSYIYPSQGELTPDFEKHRLEYTVEVENSVTSITIFAEPEISTNTLEGAGNHELNPGNNEIALIVTSPNGIRRIYYVNVIRKKNSSNDLTSLIVKADGDIQELTPTFNKDTLEYDVEVNAGIDSVEILATASENASIMGIGTKAIEVGNNKFEVIVTSEGGIVKTYTINVNRIASSNNNLLNIIPSTGSLEPTFSSEQDEYSLILDASSSMLSFNVITEDKFAKVTGLESRLIPDGLSTREIVVEAENGDRKVYTINVFKDRTDEARLSKLSIDGYTFNEEFDKDTFNYTLTVPSEKKVLLSTDVTAEPVDSRATVLKASSLSISTDGTNIYTIIVTAKDGFTKQTYTIAIEREKGSDSTLKSLEFTFGNLEEDFSSTDYEYTLKVPKDITTIYSADVIAIPTDSEATVTIPDTFNYDKENKVYEIVVTSADLSSTTTYTINLEPLESNNALLSSLSVNHGVLSPIFDKTINKYMLDLDIEIDELDISAIAEDENATIMGDGKQKVETGLNRYEIVVTAEDGTVNTYIIEATREKSSNNNITNIIPSSGSLSPSYDNDIDHYEVEVGEEIESIDFEVLLESKRATVSGDKDNSLDYGENDITITVEAEDGTTKEVYIKVIREKKITDIEVPAEILMDVGDIEVVEAKIIPENVTYKDLVWQSSDPNIVTVTDGVLEAKALGEVTITVSSARDDTIQKEISVRVLNLKISSDIYDVRRNVLYLDDDSKIQHMIIGAEILEDLDTFISKLKNEKEFIKIYTIDDDEITDTESSTVSTGQIIKLEYKGKVYDSVYMVVRGDVTGDGYINVNDSSLMVKNILSKIEYAPDTLEFNAMDIAENQNIDVNDMSIMNKYILGKEKTLN